MIVELLLLCVSLCYSLPTGDLAAQQSQKFPSFPIRGQEAEDNLPEVIRDPRQANYQFDYSDENLGLTSGQRNSRQVDNQANDYYLEAEAVYPPAARAQDSQQFDNFFNDESQALDDSQVREERDGDFHGGSHGRSRNGRRNGNNRQQQQQQPQQTFQQESLPFQENRGSRQTGEVGVALGVLNSSPNADGEYNFNFANDDGSYREESRSFQGTVEGSYGFTAPNGEQTQVEYTADENGYHVIGMPCPPAVQRLLIHLNKVNGGGPTTC
jgi:hypothetical protein